MCNRGGMARVEWLDPLMLEVRGKGGGWRVGGGWRSGYPLMAS